MKKIIILGNGGHAKSIADVIEEQGIYEIAGYIVNDDIGKALEDHYPVIGKDEDLERIYQGGIHHAVIGVGYLGKGSVRNKLCEHLKNIGYVLPAICDPSAIVSKKAFVDEGTFVGKGAVVNAGAHIGRMCIINTGAIIEHDVQVGDFSHISVGTVLCGDVQIGRECFIGANATVIQGRKVEDGCIVGAGEIIKKNILSGEC